MTLSPNTPKGHRVNQHLSSHRSTLPPKRPNKLNRTQRSPTKFHAIRCPLSTSSQPKPTNSLRYSHNKPLRMPSRHPHPDCPLPPCTVNGDSNDVKSASSGQRLAFGWQFPLFFYHESVFHVFIFPGSMRNVLVPIAWPIEIPPENLQSCL